MRSSRSLVVESLSVHLGEFDLRDVSLTVHPGTVVGLVGRNGSGKSTTLRIVADLVRPSCGSVRLGSLDHRRDEREFKQVVGFVGDNKNPYASMRVQQVLDFAKSLYDHWDAALCRAMCDELRLPLRTKIGHLSTGMHTKLGIILALSPHPEVLLLDEPSSGLDAASREWIWQTLTRAASTDGTGILLTSHGRAEIAENCASVVVLDEGRVAATLDLVPGSAEAREAVDSVMRGSEIYAD